MREFTITKRVSKQGKNSIIVIPGVLEEEISPKDLVELRIRLIKRNEG